MKDWNLLIWLSQLGLSLAVPLGSFLFLGLWLHRSLGWGRWTVILGIALGLVTGLRSLFESLKLMSRMGRHREEKQEAFNDHV